MWDSFFRIQVAMEGVVANFPNKWVAGWLRMLVFPKGVTLNAPHDKVGSKVAAILITPGAARDRLTAGIYLPKSEDDVIGRLEYAMEAVIKADPIEKRMRDAQKEGKLPQRTLGERRLAALNQGLVTQTEYDHLVYTDRLRRDVIKVDDFEHDMGRAQGGDKWQADPHKKAAVASM
jgi:acyl-CoA dehydrogenase